MSALGIGEFKDLNDLRQNWKLMKRYEPKMGDEERKELLDNWHDAIERSKNWAME